MIRFRTGSTISAEYIYDPDGMQSSTLIVLFTILFVIRCTVLGDGIIRRGSFSLPGVP